MSQRTPLILCTGGQTPRPRHVTPSDRVNVLHGFLSLHYPPKGESIHFLAIAAPQAPERRRHAMIGGMKYLLFRVVALTAFVAVPIGAQSPSPVGDDQARWWAHVKTLADDRLEGRAEQNDLELVGGNCMLIFHDVPRTQGLANCATNAAPIRIPLVDYRKRNAQHGIGLLSSVVRSLDRQ